MSRSHAYIFEGEDTSAVRSRAYSFIKSFNCQHGDGCGKCLSCRTFDSGNHPDTFFVKGTKQSGIGVDDVREKIVMPMSVKPFKYEYKVFIVEDSITPAAQNALLKTIEEPAPYGVFLFIAANTHGFLPTVLSRCVVKKFRENTSDEADTDFQPLAEEIAKAAEGADIINAFALYKKIEPLGKDELTEFLNTLYILYGKKINAAANQGIQPPQVWLNATEAIIKTKKVLSQNGNTQLAIELMLMKMR